ncbi:MAG: hypothetical protein NT155_03925 [Candidatus Staskawiczbacteria bacterium]|nr:hypothetical protein [Candidatus Staskawiczbacteria bacterium]
MVADPLVEDHIARQSVTHLAEATPLLETVREAIVPLLVEATPLVEVSPVADGPREITVHQLVEVIPLEGVVHRAEDSPAVEAIPLVEEEEADETAQVAKATIDQSVLGHLVSFFANWA